MMKKCTLAIVLILLIFSMTAYANVTVYVNDEKLETEAEILENRTIVPMRIIFEKLGAEVEWFNESQCILATKSSNLIALQIGAKRLITRDISSGNIVSTELDVAPVLKDGKTMVPIRAVAEALCANVYWDDSTKSVYITAD